MSAQTSISWLFGNALGKLQALLLLPADIAHELVHAMLAAPWADRVGIIISPREADAAAAIHWREDVPQWALVLAAYGPAIVGAISGGLAIWWALGAGELAATGNALLIRGILGVWWVVFMIPSADDRETARGD